VDSNSVIDLLRLQRIFSCGTLFKTSIKKGGILKPTPCVWAIRRAMAALGLLGTLRGLRAIIVYSDNPLRRPHAFNANPKTIDDNIPPFTD
jgi:hypothetical protein